MRVKLKYLESNTEFDVGMYTYRKGTTYKIENQVEKVLCEPYLGKQFQLNSELGIWFPTGNEVEVKA